MKSNKGCVFLMKKGMDGMRELPLPTKQGNGKI